MPAIIILGNEAPVDLRRVDELTDKTKATPLEGPRETVFIVPDEVKTVEALTTITALWDKLSRDDASFVHSLTDGNDQLVAILAENFGCQEGDKKTWKGLRHPRPLLGGSVAFTPGYDETVDRYIGLARAFRNFRQQRGLCDVLDLAAVEMRDWDRRESGLFGPTALRTNAGIDFQATQMGGTAAAASAKYIALTANATAPAATDTTLAAEIATASGGLIRAAATYAHTTATTSYTLAKTFTANGSDVLPVTVAKIGVFDASSSGSLVFTTLFGTTATLSASGDALTTTETVSL